MMGLFVLLHCYGISPSPFGNFDGSNLQAVSSSTSSDAHYTNGKQSANNESLLATWSRLLFDRQQQQQQADDASEEDEEEKTRC